MMLASSSAGVKLIAVRLYVLRRSADCGAVMSSHVARRQSDMIIIGSRVSGVMKHLYRCPRAAAYKGCVPKCWPGCAFACHVYNIGPAGVAPMTGGETAMMASVHEVLDIYSVRTAMVSAHDTQSIWMVRQSSGVAVGLPQTMSAGDRIQPLCRDLGLV